MSISSLSTATACRSLLFPPPLSSSLNTYLAQDLPTFITDHESLEDGNQFEKEFLYYTHQLLCMSISIKKSVFYEG